MKNRFWKTPQDLKNQIYKEFNIISDVCPFPKPIDYDCLKSDWSNMNFVNPPFRRMDGNGHGPTAFVRKAIEQYEKGRKSVLILPTQSYVNLLIDAGAEVRSLGCIRWLECDTNEPCKNPSPITMFILR